jgi:hypothetical protein
MTQYSLLKAGKEWKARRKGTHLDTAIAALKALGGKATGSQIADYVEEKKLLAGSEMDPAGGCLLDARLRGSVGLDFREVGGLW